MEILHGQPEIQTYDCLKLIKTDCKGNRSTTREVKRHRAVRLRQCLEENDSHYSVVFKSKTYKAHSIKLLCVISKHSHYPLNCYFTLNTNVSSIFRSLSARRALGINGSIILKWILEKECGRMRIGFIWLGMGTSGRLL
jgi:hypothetical protein